MEKVHQGGYNFILQGCKLDFFFSFVQGVHHVNIFSSSAPDMSRKPWEFDKKKYFPKKKTRVTLK
jgi:hypothetical protein